MPPDPSRLSAEELELLEFMNDAWGKSPIQPSVVPSHLAHQIAPLMEKGLIREPWPQETPGIKIDSQGLTVVRTHLERKRQAQYQALLGGGSTVINISNSRGFIAGSQQGFTQNNC
jgi:tRNA pseudouridine-54 N-methylase